MKARDVARALGVELASWRPAGAGQGRTAFAETVEGARVVVKWFAERRESLAGTVRVVEVLRGRGYPAPTTVAFGAVGEGQGWIQERLPGEPCLDGANGAVLDHLMAAVALQAAADQDPGDGWSYVGGVVFEGEEGCWPAARARSPEAAAVCERLERWVRAVPRAAVRRDFVHLDLNFTNVLAVGDRLTGIVDLDHLGPGDDRSVDLVSLLFHYLQLRYERGHPPPAGAADRIRREVLEISGEPGWRQAVAFRAVSDLAWTGRDGRRVPPEPTLAAICALID
jgi:hypothetical protein